MPVFAAASNCGGTFCKKEPREAAQGLRRKPQMTRWEAATEKDPQ